MSKLWASEFVTLDGVIEAPEEWMGPAASPESYELLGRDVAHAERHLMGRQTYDDLHSYWPHMGDEVPMAKLTNESKKTVASTSVSVLSWGPDTIVTADAVSWVREFKASGTGDICLSGSANLFQGLLAADLVDELRIFLVPYVRGTGKRLFADSGRVEQFTRTDSVSLPNGLMYLYYEQA